MDHLLAVSHLPSGEALSAELGKAPSFSSIWDQYWSHFLPADRPPSLGQLHWNFYFEIRHWLYRICKGISTSGLSPAFLFSYSWCDILWQHPDSAQDTVVHRGPTLEGHHLPCLKSPMLQTTGKAVSCSGAVTLLKRCSTVRLQACMALVLLLLSCFSHHVAFPPIHYSDATKPHYLLLGNLFFWVSFHRLALFPHTLHFCLALKSFSWILGSHESLYQLRTEGICSSPTAMAAGIHLLFSSFPQYPSTPQSFPRAPPTLLPSKPLSPSLGPFPAPHHPSTYLWVTLTPTLVLTHPAHKKFLCKSPSHHLNLILNFPFNL